MGASGDLLQPTLILSHFIKEKTNFWGSCPSVNPSSFHTSSLTSGSWLAQATSPGASSGKLWQH